MTDEAKINPILYSPKLYRALMALRLEVPQSIVDSMAEIIGEELIKTRQEAAEREREKLRRSVELWMDTYEKNQSTFSTNDFIKFVTEKYD